MSRQKLIDHGSALAGVCAVILVVIILNLITAPERPVMRFILSSGSWEIKSGTAMNHFYGDKIAYEDRFCEIIPYSHYGKFIYAGDLIDKHITVEWVDDDDPEDTFPPGMIEVGYVRWHFPEGYDINRVNKVGLLLTWDCGLRNVTQSFWYDLPLLGMRDSDD